MRSLSHASTLAASSSSPRRILLALLVLLALLARFAIRPSTVSKPALRELDPRDDALVNLVGTIRDAQRARLHEERGERHVARDAGAAVHLDGVVDDLLQHVRGDDFDGRNLGHRGERA